MAERTTGGWTRWADIAYCLAVALVLRLYQLDTLPGEWYSDISAVQERVAQILAGQWPYRFNSAQGPLYHYLVAPLVLLFGPSYPTYKLLSALTSLAVIALTMLMAYDLAGRSLALLVGYVSAVGSALLIFSRLGDYLMIIPLLTVGMVYGVVRFTRHNTARSALASASVATLGLFAAPHTTLLPPLCLLLLLLYLQRPWRDHIRYVVYALLPMALGGLLFALIVLNNQDNFRTGYLGAKLFGAGGLDWTTFIQVFLRNLGKTALMYHGTGDHVFRSNIPFQPHLDSVSGVFMVVGLVSLALRPLRKYAALILLPLVILVLPSAWPGIVDIEVPSASRTIASLPFAYLLVAVGLWTFDHLLRQRVPVWLSRGVLAVLLVVLLALNYERYFVAYASHLPAHNTAFGRLIALDILRQPPGSQMFVLGCCWDEWDMPEREAIQYALRGLPPIVFTWEPREVCEQARGRPGPVAVYVDPDNPEQRNAVAACLPGGEMETAIGPYDYRVYLRYTVDRGP
ncbi:MAG: hypothetical protein KIT87_05630 [Anaerolineae bacterium]|nr:hypothetical protein [Anaerolineae bacterium]